MKKLLTLMLIVVLVGCATNKGAIPNYKVVNGSYQIWRYTKVGEPTKDIMSTGDTIITTRDTLYIKKREIKLDL